MSKEIYIKLDKSGFVIGGYVNKLFACHSVFNDPTVKIVKVHFSDDDVLTEQEAIETIQEYNKRT